MKDFHPALQQGEYERAEAVLDRALGMLEADPDDKGPGEKGPGKNGPGDRELEDKGGGPPVNRFQLDQYRRKADETQFLILPIKEAGQLYSGRTAELEKAVKEMKQRLGAVADPANFNWGFHLIIPAWRLDPEHLFNEKADPQMLATGVKAAFDVALRQDVAVYFTVENLEWTNRPDLWNFGDKDKPGYDPENAKNVEWMDWQGTPHPHRFRDWGTPEKMPPVICYNSPKVLAETTRLARRVIGPQIAAGLKRLAAAGKGHLFGGVTVGAEPSLPNYEAIEKVNPRIARLMQREGVPQSRLGYNALTNLGYSKAKPPKIFAEALANVNRMYISHWARQLAEGGVPVKKMYSHVAAGAGVVGSPGVQFTNAPISIAFANYCRPGWTTYPIGPLRHDFRVLYEQLAAHDNPPWASTEATPRGLGPGGLSMREYLQRHFDFGATVVVFNTGATDPDLAGRLNDAVWGDEAIEAYRDRLDGAEEAP